MHILIVDDEAMQRDMLQGFLEKQGFHVLAASGGREALQLFHDNHVDLVLLDHRMEDMNGDEVMARIKSTNPLVHAIMITAYGSVDTAVKVMQLGADDFLEKPVDLEVLLQKIRDIEEELIVGQEAESVKETISVHELPIKLIGDSPAMQDVLSLVQRAAATPWTVLIRGETGTGKEMIARLLHLLSDRTDRPFLELNCAAVPETLFESELFGHEKGAFTGANSRRLGVVEQADKGTLFLDEIGETPLSVQAKLLRALQEKKITRVGGSGQIPVDVRIVAATNRDLKKMVQDTAFREDLYFRLNVIEIEVPPLRRRKEDIPLLLDFFMEKYAVKPLTIASDALDLLVRYSYPGNIRELEHLVQRLITMTRTSTINAAMLPAELRENSGEKDGDLNARLAAFERKLLIQALDENDWVQTKAADALGISERVLRYKMQKAGIKKQ